MSRLGIILYFTWNMGKPTVVILINTHSLTNTFWAFIYKVLPNTTDMDLKGHKFLVFVNDFLKNVHYQDY